MKDSPEAQKTVKTVSASTVKPNKIDSKATYMGEQVTAILARVSNSDGTFNTEEEKGGPRTEVRSRGSQRRDRAVLPSKPIRKRKMSPLESDNGEEGWTCGKPGHFKDEFILWILCM